MAKEKDTTKQDKASAQQQDTVPAASPAGTTIITAQTRDELTDKVQAFIKEHKGEHLYFGAVGRSKDNGVYSQRIDII